MNEREDDELDHRLSPPVDPIPPPPGSFEKIRHTARQRRRYRTGALFSTATLLCVGGFAGGLAVAGGGSAPAPPVVVGTSSPALTNTGGPASTAPENTPTPSSTAEETSDPQQTDTGGESAPAQETPTSDAEDETETEETVTRCHTGEVSAEIIPGGAAAGSRYATMVFINDSDEPCTLDGHPGMLLLDENQESLPTDVRRVEPEPRRVVLQPGGAASATLRWSPMPTGDKPCQEPAEYTLITPPDAYTQLTVPFTASACHGVIYATSVVSGDDGATG